MAKPNILKGVLFVGTGASSYGMLATFVKLAYKENFTTAEVMVAQFVYGILGMLLINLLQKIASKKPIEKATSKNIFHLMLSGTSLGLTSVFYYLSVKFIDVSIAIILLMQTVWIAVLLEWYLDKTKPTIQKIIAVFIVLIGTILATNILFNPRNIDWRGIVFGLLAAVSFTATMYTSNKIATYIAANKRSLFMLLGGFIVIVLFAFFTQKTTFNFEIFYKWGIVLALFGTLLPPILMNKGFPITGIGLGSIASALELPVSVVMAYVLLHEKVVFLQWLGIVLILFAIAYMNLKSTKK